MIQLWILNYLILCPSKSWTQLNIFQSVSASVVNYNIFRVVSILVVNLVLNVSGCDNRHSHESISKYLRLYPIQS